MSKSYHILNECLRELKKSGLPEIEILNVEILLIRTKRILLSEGAEVGFNYLIDESQFLELHLMVKLLCRYNRDRIELEKVKENITRLNDSLAAKLSAKASDNADGVKNVETTGSGLITKILGHY